MFLMNKHTHSHACTFKQMYSVSLRLCITHTRVNTANSKKLKFILVYKYYQELLVFFLGGGGIQGTICKRWLHLYISSLSNVAIACWCRLKMTKQMPFIEATQNASCVSGRYLLSYEWEQCSASVSDSRDLLRTVSPCFPALWNCKTNLQWLVMIYLTDFFANSTRASHNSFSYIPSVT